MLINGDVNEPVEGELVRLQLHVDGERGRERRGRIFLQGCRHLQVGARRNGGGAVASGHVSHADALGQAADFHGQVRGVVQGLEDHAAVHHVLAVRDERDPVLVRREVRNPDAFLEKGGNNKSQRNEFFLPIEQLYLYTL